MVTLGQHVAVGLVRGLALCVGLSVIVFVGHQLDVDRGHGGTEASTTPQLRALSPDHWRYLERHRCSTEGFGPGRPVGGAVIRRGESVLHVTFEEGWEVYTSDRGGTLLAVCIEGPRRGPRRL